MLAMNVKAAMEEMKRIIVKSSQVTGALEGAADEKPLLDFFWDTHCTFPRGEIVKTKQI